MKKTRGLMIILGIYILSFVIGYLFCFKLDGWLLKLFVFDTVATIVVFIFSVIFRNSSVYDAYWSVAPMVMAIWLFAVERVSGIMQIIFLAVFLIWGLRLTINWIVVFTDFSYEDWRYKKFRDQTPRIFWPIVNFFGIHYMPTLVVFAGMLPILIIVNEKMDIRAIPGILIMLFGICLEFFADRQMHAFLNSDRSGEVCNIGLWKYTRHPNYLGEISFWMGVYITMLPFSLQYWYYGLGALAVAILFNVVSIPLMEKRQLTRRPKYVEYKECTSRLIIRPQKRDINNI